MNKKIFGIGTAIVAVALTASVAVAQRANVETDDAQAGPGAQRMQGAGPQAGAPGQQIGQGRGGRGQMGLGQGRGGRGGMGTGQGMGPGQGMGRGMGPGAGRGLGPGNGRGGMLGARLDLTDDQQKAVEALHRATRDQASALGDELELAKKTLHREAFADKRDAATITTLAAKVTTLEKQLFDLHLKTQTSVADLLTPAQRETMRLAGGGPGGQGRGPGRGAGRGR